MLRCAACLTPPLSESGRADYPVRMKSESHHLLVDAALPQQDEVVSVLPPLFIKVSLNLFSMNLLQWIFAIAANLSTATTSVPTQEPPTSPAARGGPLSLGWDLARAICQWLGLC